MKIPVEEQYKYVKLTLPDGSKVEGQAVLLHACCAPCSAAIVECMLRNGMKPTVYFSNSNIYPQQEYDVRKHELKRFLEAQNVPYVEDEYDHHEWLSVIKGLEDEPERGSQPLFCLLSVPPLSCSQVCAGAWISPSYYHVGIFALEEYQADRYCRSSCR